MTRAEKAVVRAANAWFNSDSYVGAGWPSGLRVLTARSAWNPSPPMLRLARAVAKYQDALSKRRRLP